jgi:Zn-dependent M28 family amino/carboxypeptidase
MFSLGSGVVALLETLKILIQGGFSPLRTVEFHFYSAEEAGLRGSQDIAVAYKKKGTKVAGMLELDMCGYNPDPKDQHIGLFTDYADHDLTEFVAVLIDNYNSIPYRRTECKYGCSDHAAWNMNKFPALYVAETVMEVENPYYHSSKDSIDTVDFNHVAEFVKLSIAFVTEIAGWNL